MAIRMVTGVPGAGKTYFAVKHLAETYCTWDKESQEYKLKKDITIFTNIDSLILPHINLDEAIKASCLGIAGFFTVEYQEKISKKYSNIVYLLDEAQRWFPRRNKLGADTWYYFEYHRHLGHDIYIITQDKKLVADNITLLIEYEIRAAKRFTSVMGEMRYMIKSDGEIMSKKSVKPSKAIFNLYKSMDAKESETIKNPLRKWAVVLIIIVCLGGYYFQKTFIRDGKVMAMRPDPVNTSAAASGSPGYSSGASPGEVVQSESYLKKVKCSYIMYSDHMLIVDPVTSELIPSFDFPYDIDVKKIGRFFTVYAQVPVHLLPVEKPEPSEKSEQAQRS